MSNDDVNNDDMSNDDTGNDDMGDDTFTADPRWGDLDADPALASAVLEIEQHLAGNGWDQPARLYALVDTAALAAQEPELAAAMGLDAAAERGSLTAVEQEQLDPGTPLEQVLESIVWPEAVAGCAAMVERLVLPPGTDAEVPDDVEAAQAFAREHPDRQEVRIVAGATRSGSTYCALRLRAHDDDTSVVGGLDLVPGLLELLRATLHDDTDDTPTDPTHDAKDHTP
ncbi:PPA1309 family protein [Nocardioides sp. C4-1]|uniref:PPA1309 family protein n=1 Tax=Nocardioides sp. C4-1 TaxID=3151851 RepID=UPI003265AECF